MAGVLRHIEHAEGVLAALYLKGIDADMVTGKTASGRRNDLINRFKAGHLRCLVNVACLTTGFDALTDNVDYWVSRRRIMVMSRDQRAPRRTLPLLHQGLERTRMRRHTRRSPVEETV